MLVGKGSEQQADCSGESRRQRRMQVGRVQACQSLALVIGVITCRDLGGVDQQERLGFGQAHPGIAQPTGEPVPCGNLEWKFGVLVETRSLTMEICSHRTFWKRRGAGYGC